MATLLPFSEISKHLKIKAESKKVLIDTCSLIAFSHGVNEFSDETEGLSSFSEVYKKLKAHTALAHKKAKEGRPLVLNDSDIKRFKNYFLLNIKILKMFG